MRGVTVLISGIGGPGGTGTIKSLRLIKERKIKIVGVDMDKDAAALVLVDKHYLVPAAEDKRFLPELLKISKKERVEVILPLSGSDVYLLSCAKKEFAKHGIKILISEPEVLKIANNKYLLLKHCQKNGIPTPIFYLAKNYREFKKAVLSLGYPQKKVCFKPTISKGTRGFRILSQKFDRLDSLVSSKSTEFLMTLEEAESIFQKTKKFPELLVMEYLPGDEYSVDALADNGKAIVIVPRLREKIKMGISVVGTTVKEREVIKYSKEIIETLKLHGNVGFQFRKDKAGIPKILESNPRLQGTTVLCTASRANLVYLGVKLALGEKIVKPKIKWGTKMLRFWQELYYDKSGHAFTL